MTKQPFKPNIDEDLNRPHNVTLTEGQISTILYVMEGYLQGDDKLDDEFVNDCDNIFEQLEGVVDKYYETPVVNTFSDYGSKVDSLVDSMTYSGDEGAVNKVSTGHRKIDLDAL